MPRKVVFEELGKSESWYSLLLNAENFEILPSVVELRRIILLTANVEPLRVLARWSAEGQDPFETVDPHRLLSAAIHASGKFTGALAAVLEDGTLSEQDAIDILPEAEAQLQQAQQAVDALRKRIRRRR